MIRRIGNRRVFYVAPDQPDCPARHHCYAQLCADRHGRGMAQTDRHPVKRHQTLSAGALGQTGTAKVGFVLDRRGRLVSHWLEESTGSEPLDVESLAIVERAQPFPIPPSELDETHLRMSAPFVFAARPAHHLRDSPDIGKIREIFEGEAQVDTKMRSICRGC